MSKGLEESLTQYNGESLEAFGEGCISQDGLQFLSNH